MGSEKRLKLLEQMTKGVAATSFAWYGLALEYLSFERTDEAFETFQTLRKSDPNYLAMYLICGTMLGKQGRNEEAREWLNTGLDIAYADGETRAVSEIETALAEL